MDCVYGIKTAIESTSYEIYYLLAPFIGPTSLLIVGIFTLATALPLSWRYIAFFLYVAAL